MNNIQIPKYIQTASKNNLIINKKTHLGQTDAF